MSVGMAINEQFPDAKIVVWEKEKELATHQTGHNSGVIHSGIYYEPGSYKAIFARQGNESMQSFCRENEIPFDMCGKVIVATDNDEVKRLKSLYKRGLQNQLDLEMLDKEKLLEIEPHVNGMKAILVKNAGIVNYKQVTEKMAEIIEGKEAKIILG